MSGIMEGFARARSNSREILSMVKCRADAKQVQIQVVEPPLIRLHMRESFLFLYKKHFVVYFILLFHTNYFSQSITSNFLENSSEFNAPSLEINLNAYRLRMFHTPFPSSAVFISISLF